jgi:hypothetical protein
MVSLAKQTLLKLLDMVAILGMDFDEVRMVSARSS